eukprot:346578-Amphidinium_carterae.1
MLCLFVQSLFLWTYAKYASYASNSCSDGSIMPQHARTSEAAVMQREWNSFFTVFQEASCPPHNRSCVNAISMTQTAHCAKHHPTPLLARNAIIAQQSATRGHHK